MITDSDNVFNLALIYPNIGRAAGIAPRNTENTTI